MQPHSLPAGTAEPPTSKGFLRFEHITLCPIQTKLINSSLLNEEERAWVNAYHDEVYAKLLPVLEKQGDERAIAWLKKECSARV